jgi:hypothetical protein
MYFDIVLLVYLAYKNSVRAKLKAQSAITWAFITVVAFLVTYFAGYFFVVVFFCRDVVKLEQIGAVDYKAKQAIAQQLVDAFAANPLHLLTVEMFGLGGYLLIRYILDRMPDKKQPEVHWMDKMGDQ